MSEIKKMPMVALRGLLVFPHTVIYFDVGREISVSAIEESMTIGQEIFLVTQKDLQIEVPKIEDVYETGTISKVKQVLKLPGGGIRVLVEGMHRAKLISYAKTQPFLEGEILEYEVNEEEAQQDILLKEAYVRRITELFDKFSSYSSRVSAETLFTISEIKEPGKFADMIASNISVKIEDKQQILDAVDVLTRLKTVMEILQREIEILEIDREIAQTVRQQIDKNQKEYFLREQIKAIQKELGDGGTEKDDLEELKEKLNSLNLPEEVKQKVQKELARMQRMSQSSPEVSVIRSYLDWIAELPWGIETQDNLDLKHCRKILDKEHFGLEKVKDRIIEFLAVKKLKKDMQGTILCFAGPPGVGKTSIAHSIANALEKKFVRMSLGGVRDEAEIRGHRRTYIGAIPGRIISLIKQAKSVNPVFLLDEIDKMGNDFRGDPASAMLEVLDPSINNTFTDHYLECEFDLSKVMFITTANDISAIPDPLYDRMEIINIDSYTDFEKLNIAKKHLVKKQEEENGLPLKTVKLTDSVIMDIIHNYTRESGVRSLERQIATIMRKSAAKYVNGEEIAVTKTNLEEYLGLPKSKESCVLNKDTVGVVMGLAWTRVGGQILPVEVSVFEGNGRIELTGQLGDVMKESAKTGISVVRSIANSYKLPKDFAETMDIHIHAPEGAIPKDGPSAGVTITTALISAFTKIPVRHDIAMTGEITLTGRVLKIGGIKEKALAALRAGIHTIILPKDNKNDLTELPKSVQEKLEFIFVTNIKEVLKVALRKAEHIDKKS